MPIYSLSRETYKRIKHYDKVHLETYLNMVRENGRLEGMQQAFGKYIAGMSEIYDKVPGMTPEMKDAIIKTTTEELGSVEEKLE